MSVFADVDAGVALLAPGSPLGEPWMATDHNRRELDCDLCASPVAELWPLYYHPADPDLEIAKGELLVCHDCAVAIRPPDLRPPPPELRLIRGA